MVMVRASFLWASVLIALYSNSEAQELRSNVKIVGTMKDVMWKGQLSGTIVLDTIPNKQHLFGLDPVEYLAGEIVIVDGKAYKATVLNDSTMKVEETYAIKAPFFAYSNINRWTQIKLPDTVQTIPQLEFYLEHTTQNRNRPFLFRFTGKVEQATVHIVNLPKGTTLNSPADAHQGQRSFLLKDREVDVIGFFSTAHKGVFTHHDTHIHMHLITSDRRKMGHLDDARFRNGTLSIGHP